MEPLSSYLASICGESIYDDDIDYDYFRDKEAVEKRAGESDSSTEESDRD